jgi:CRISPR-associated endonuclease Csn1
MVHQSNRTLWDVRAEAVERKLSEQELAAVLYHLVRHRGYFPNTKQPLPDDLEDDEVDEEQGKINRAISNLRRELQASDCKTVGQFLARYRERQRNRIEDYSNLMPRKLVAEEAQQILTFQREQGYELSQEFETKYLDVLMNQRSGRSPKLGNCSLIPSELRAPACAPSTEWFKFLQNLGNLQIANVYKDEWELTEERHNQIIAACSERSTSSYWQIRRDLQIPEEYRFNMVRYEPQKPNESLQKYLEKQEGKTLANFRYWKQLEKILGGGYSVEILDKVAHQITVIKDEEKLADQLADLLPEASDMAITKLCGLDFTTVAKISLAAIYRILPHMKKGKGYYDACQQEGLPEAEATLAGDRVPPFDEMYNPVVNRALSQSRKLINAVIDQYGMPSVIRVELARDLGRGREERGKIEREQRKFGKENERRAEEFRQEFKMEQRGDQGLRYRLWQEQDCTCPYSGELIKINSVLSEDTQIDHILPISRSFDNSLNNKVLCFVAENAQKGNQTPFEYLDAERFQRLETICARWPEARRTRLLHKSFGKVSEDWKSRALNDTRYLTSALANHVRQHLPDVKVQTVNGRITSYLRKQWGLEKDRNKHTHHAVDAMVVACTTPAMVQQVTLYHQDIRHHKQLGDKRPTPWPETFRQDVLEAESKVFITRHPQRVSGGLHPDTLQKHQQNSQPDRERVALVDVKLDDLERLVEKDASNAKLYAYLKQCLEEADNQPKVAFKPPFYMPTGPEAKQRPILGKVTLFRKKPEGNKQLAELGDGRLYDSMSQGRLDVYRYRAGGKRKDEYRVVLQRMINLMNGELNNRVFLNGKPLDKGPELDDHYEFLFSVYPDDLVEFRRTEAEEAVYGYYRGFHINKGCLITSMYENGIRVQKDISIVRAAHFAKAQVNLLGKVSR